MNRTRTALVCLWVFGLSSAASAQAPVDPSAPLPAGHPPVGAAPAGEQDDGAEAPEGTVEGEFREV